MRNPFEQFNPLRQIIDKDKEKSEIYEPIKLLKQKLDKLSDEEFIDFLNNSDLLNYSLVLDLNLPVKIKVGDYIRTYHKHIIIIDLQRYFSNKEQKKEKPTNTSANKEDKLTHKTLENNNNEQSKADKKQFIAFLNKIRQTIKNILNINIDNQTEINKIADELFIYIYHKKRKVSERPSSWLNVNIIKDNEIWRDFNSEEIIFLALFLEYLYENGLIDIKENYFCQDCLIVKAADKKSYISPFVEKIIKDSKQTETEKTFKSESENKKILTFLKQQGIEWFLKQFENNESKRNKKISVFGVELTLLKIARITGFVDRYEKQYNKKVQDTRNFISKKENFELLVKYIYGIELNEYNKNKLLDYLKQQGIEWFVEQFKDTVSKRNKKISVFGVELTLAKIAKMTGFVEWYEKQYNKKVQDTRNFISKKENFELLVKYIYNSTIEEETVNKSKLVIEDQLTEQTIDIDDVFDFLEISNQEKRQKILRLIPQQNQKDRTNIDGIDIKNWLNETEIIKNLPMYTDELKIAVLILEILFNRQNNLLCIIHNNQYYFSPEIEKLIDKRINKQSSNNTTRQSTPKKPPILDIKHTKKPNNPKSDIQPENPENKGKEKNNEKLKKLFLDNINRDEKNKIANELLRKYGLDLLDKIINFLSQNNLEIKKTNSSLFRQIPDFYYQLAILIIFKYNKELNKYIGNTISKVHEFSIAKRDVVTNLKSRYKILGNKDIDKIIKNLFNISEPNYTNKYGIKRVAANKGEKYTLNLRKLKEKYPDIAEYFYIKSRNQK